ncbi:unnamed protein product [Cercospora beticola]|nr:unnamed protein product [Cercospora beticola]
MASEDVESCGGASGGERVPEIANGELQPSAMSQSSSRRQQMRHVYFIVAMATHGATLAAHDRLPSGTAVALPFVVATRVEGSGISLD